MTDRKPVNLTDDERAALIREHGLYISHHFPHSADVDLADVIKRAERIIELAKELIR